MFQFTAESIQEVLNSIHEALFIHDYDSGRVLYVNNRMGELYDCTYEQALNDSANEFSLGKPPYSMTEAMQWIHKTKTEGEQVFEWIARKKSGETFWTEVSLRIANINKEKYIIAVVRDISARKKIEFEKQKTVAQLQSILDSSTSVIAIINCDGVFIDGNKELFNRWGKSKEQIIGHSAKEILPAHIFKSRMKIIGKVIKTGKGITFIDEYDGKWFENTITPIIEADGKVETVSMFSQDITSRENAEIELRKSEERFKILFEQAVNGIFIRDPSGNIIDVNNKATELTGYSREELLKMNSNDLFSKEEIKRIPFQLDLLKKGKVVTNERILTRKDGSICYIESNTKMMPDNTIQSILRDITDRRNLENALRESEEKYRTFIESAPDSILIIKNGLIQYVNHVLLKISCYSEKELIKKPFINYVSKRDHEIVMQYYNKRMAGDITPVGYEAYAILKDGRELPVEVNSSVFTYLGEKLELVFLRNISERKNAEKIIRENEEKYRLIFENSPLGLFSFDEKGVILTCNDNFVKIIGSSKEKLIGLSMLNLPDKNIASSVQKALNGSLAIYEGIYSSVTADKITPVRCIFAPVKTGSALRGMGIVEDITERKSIEIKILKLNEELEKLVKIRTIELENSNVFLKKEIEDKTNYEELIKLQLQEREVLLKEIHHRVKNNMQIIISILNLQASFTKNKKLIEILQDSQTRIKTMALVHEKLYQAKDFSNINFTQYITNLLEYLFASYRSPNQDVKFRINTETIPIEMDNIISLGLITNELVSNSFKYAFTGNVEGEIDVSFKKLDDANLIFSVKDNGKGLPADLDYRNTESLGLQLVCILTDQIHGKLDVESSDKGTTFSIIFPAK